MQPDHLGTYWFARTSARLRPDIVEEPKLLLMLRPGAVGLESRH